MRGVGLVVVAIGGAGVVAGCRSQPSQPSGAEHVAASSGAAGSTGAPAAVSASAASAPASAATNAPARARPKSKADCPPGTAFVPGGGFDVDGGTAPSPPPADACVIPKSRVRVEAFCIDVTEVSRKAYEACADCEKFPKEDTARASCAQTGDPNLPVVCVGVPQAERYCRTRGMRLPTDDEWEFAARGPKALQYPWGNTPIDIVGREDVSPNVCAGRDFHRVGSLGPCPVGSRDDRSPFGVLDMFGNVPEWTSNRCSDMSGRPQFLIRGHNSSTFMAFDSELPKARFAAFGDASAGIGFRCAGP
ncbi:formylglycine-generating enzyme family protein [Pendulispora albinea]|uniref:formylglycine-generating enzyme family protein n=1 Tax=Pendulispora albinea TaxID=2741071 RepID=UPI00374DFCCA